MRRSLLLLCLLPWVATAQVARVLKVDTDRHIVEAELWGTTLHLKVPPLLHLAAGSMARVEFDCVKNAKGRCDFQSPYVLRLNETAVDVLSWRFPAAEIEAWVHHAPGDPGEASFLGLILHCNVDGGEILMTLRPDSESVLRQFARLEGNRPIRITVPGNEPRHVLVDGQKFVTVTIVLTPRAVPSS